MKKLWGNLPFRLLLGVIIGILVGRIANEDVMHIVVAVKYVLGQLITFCVPLIIIGFIAPSITKLGRNASRILGVAVIGAYMSSVGRCAFFHGRRIWNHSTPFDCIRDSGDAGTARNYIQA